MADEKLTVEEVAQTTTAVQEALIEEKTRSQAALKAMEDKVAKDMDEMRTKMDEVYKQRTLNRLANDYSGEAGDMFMRSRTDTGPYARAERGEPLPTHERAIVRFGEVCDTILAGCQLMGIPPERYNEGFVGEHMTSGKYADAQSRSLWAEFQNMRTELFRTNTTIDTTELTNWMPTEFSPQVQNRYTLALKVVAFLNSVTMPRSPLQLPVMWARKSLAHSMAGEMTDVPWTQGHKYTPAEDVTPGVMTLTAKKCYHFTPLSDEVYWESIIAMLPLLLADHGDFHAWAQENGVVNGDTSSTHQDTNVTGGSGSTDFRAAYKGLRKLAIAGSCSTDVNTNPYTTAVLRGLRESMLKYGTVPSETAMLHGPLSYIKLLSNNDVKTVDVAGVRATVPSGTLAVFDGHPIIVSEAMQETLDTDGCVDSSGVADNHAYMLVNKRGFLIGNRMPIQTIYSDELLLLFGGKMMLSLSRNAFSPIWTPSTTVPTVWYGYNIDN